MIRLRLLFASLFYKWAGERYRAAIEAREYALPGTTIWALANVSEAYADLLMAVGDTLTRSNP